MRAFTARFPEIFAEKYRDKYKADPARYGDHNWDRVSIELHRATGITVQGVESDLLQIAGELAPDVMMVVDYGLLIPPDVLAIPRLGCINGHASLLPRWRGAAPIHPGNRSDV